MQVCSEYVKHVQPPADPGGVGMGSDDSDIRVSSNSTSSCMQHPNYAIAVLWRGGLHRLRWMEILCEFDTVWTTDTSNMHVNVCNIQHVNTPAVQSIGSQGAVFHPEALRPRRDWTM